MIRDRVLPCRNAIIAPEPISPVVATAALLGEAGFGLERAGVRVHSEIAATNINFAGLRLLTSAVTRTKRAGFAVNDSAAEAVGAVDPVVQAKT